ERVEHRLFGRIGRRFVVPFRRFAGRWVATVGARRPTERTRPEVEHRLYRLAPRRPARLDRLLGTEFREHVARALDDWFGDACEVRDVNPVRSVGRTVFDRAEEGDFLPSFVRRDVD